MHQKKKKKKREGGGVAQGIDLEFKPQYHIHTSKKKKRNQENYLIHKRLKNT
jgi:hypothetical protein